MIVIYENIQCSAALRIKILSQLYKVLKYSQTILIEPDSRRVVAQGLQGVEIKIYYLISTEFQFCDTKSYRDGWQ